MASFYRLTTIGTVNGEEWIQNYFYRSPDTPASFTIANGLITASGWAGNGTGPANQIRTLLNQATVIDSVVCRNITEPRDFAVRPSTFIGATPTLNAVPTFLAFKLTSSRSRADIRSSTRSIPVGEEGFVNSFGSISQAAFTQLTAFAGALSTPIDLTDAESNPIRLSPVTIKRRLYVTSSGKDAYEIPDDLDYLEANHSVITEYRVASTVTTQNSRKVGRGA